MATRMRSSISRERLASFLAYSRPACVSWMEHGPTMTRSRPSLPLSVLAIWFLDSRTNSACSGVLAISCRSISGVGSGWFWVTRMSEVCCTGRRLIVFSYRLSSLKRLGCLFSLSFVSFIFIYDDAEQKGFANMGKPYGGLGSGNGRRCGRLPTEPV